MKAIVTFKFKRDPEHNPKNKKEGTCKLGHYCTDVTGEHHSYIIEGKDKKEIKSKAKLLCDHITRIEIIQ